MQRGIGNASDGVKIPFLVWLLGSSGSSRQNYSLHEIWACCSAMGEDCTPSPLQVHSESPGPVPEPLQFLLRPLNTGVICTCTSSLFTPTVWGLGSFLAKRPQNSTSSLVAALEKLSFIQSAVFFPRRGCFLLCVYHLYLLPKDF